MDEAQFEITHGLLSYKKFESEAALIDFIKANEGWMVVAEAKGFFAGKTLVRDICEESVIKASRKFKLNITLAIDPQLGDSWKSCH